MLDDINIDLKEGETQCIKINGTLEYTVTRKTLTDADKPSFFMSIESIHCNTDDWGDEDNDTQLLESFDIHPAQYVIDYDDDNYDEDDDDYDDSSEYYEDEDD